MDQHDPRDSRGDKPSATATLRARPSTTETLTALFTPPKAPGAPELGNTSPVVHPPDTHGMEDTVAFLDQREQGGGASVTGTVFRGSAPSATASQSQSPDLSTPSPLRDGRRPIEAPDGLDRNLALARLQERMLGVQAEAVKIGRFIVIRKLGQGAMGIVYLAYDPKLDRKVALKLVDTTALGSEVGDAQVRLEREAKAAAALGHPNVVTVYDVGEHGDDVFLAMEFVEGTCLTDWMKQEHEWREVVTLFSEIARGLAAAHEADLVHRDFKPDNVLLGEDGRPRVADFGLARPTEGWTARDAAKMLGDGGESMRALAIRSQDALASTGEVCGTPAYMAPEQFAGIDVGPASDQFGFCASLYEALFGHRPFKGDSVTELAVAVLENDRQPLPPKHGVPKAVVEAVLMGLEPKVSNRHASMRALADRLDAALRARTRNRVLAGGALLAVLSAGLGVQASQAIEEQPCDAAQAEIDEIWNPDRRSKVERAVAAAGLPTKAVEHLDRFASDWTDQRVESCRASRVEGSQSDEELLLRTSCLDQMSARLDVAARALQESPSSEALDVLEIALPSLEACEDPASLRAQRTEFFRSGEQSLEAQAAWSEAAGLITALQLTSHRPPSAWQADAERLLALGETHEIPSANAYGRFWMGEVARQHEDFDTVIEQSRQGLAWAARSPDYAILPLLLLLRAEAERRQGELDAAAASIELGQAMVSRVFETRKREAVRVDLEAAQAMVAIERGELEHAREIAGTLLESENLSPRKQEHVHSILGSVCYQLHDTDCAFEHHAKAMALVATLPDVEPLELAGRHANMGLMYAEAGDGPKAIGELATAADIVEDAFDADHPMRGQLLSDRGGIQGAMMDPKDGEKDLLAGLAIHEKNHGKDHPALVEALIDLTKTQMQLGKPVEATKHGEWAVRIVDGAFEGQHPRRADPRLPLSDAYVAMGRFDDAAKVLREGLEILDTPQTHPMQRAEFQFALARALAPVDAEAAREAATAAKAGIADFEPGKPLRDAIDGWSAQVLDAPEQPAL